MRNEVCDRCHPPHGAAMAWRQNCAAFSCRGRSAFPPAYPAALGCFFPPPFSVFSAYTSERTDSLLELLL